MTKLRECNINSSKPPNQEHREGAFTSDSDSASNSSRNHVITPLGGQLQVSKLIKAKPFKNIYIILIFRDFTRERLVFEQDLLSSSEEMLLSPLQLYPTDELQVCFKRFSARS